MNVLFVDDEQSILNSIKRMLRSETYNIYITDSPTRALEIIKETEISVVVSDQRMPQMTGSELLEKIKQVSPNTIRIILTGYADLKAIIASVNKGSIFRFLTKPWDPEELKEAIKQSLELYHIGSEKDRLKRLNIIQNEKLKKINKSLESEVTKRTEHINRLNKNLKKSFLATIELLVELNSTYIDDFKEHSERIKQLALKISSEMMLTPKEKFEIEIASMLHDIGKSKINTNIINKSIHNLRIDEHEELKKHSIYSEELIKKIPFIGDVPKIVRAHHEDFNGSGYPDKLSGDDIPLGARILHVADAYERELYDSSQKGTEVKAFSFVKALSGERFDPNVVAALEKILRTEHIELDEHVESIELYSNDLKPGMILFTDLLTSQGRMLLKKGTKLTSELIKTILDYEEHDYFPNGIQIHVK